MYVKSWSDEVSKSDVRHRAGGRRRYNAQRQFAAQYRRKQLVKLMIEQDLFPTYYGAKTALAKALNVSVATISRDFLTLIHESWNKTCPLCGQGGWPSKQRKK